MKLATLSHFVALMLVMFPLAAELQQIVAVPSLQEKEDVVAKMFLFFKLYLIRGDG